MIERRSLAGLARLVHPFPTMLNVFATAGLALVAAEGSPDPCVLARMLVLMFCAQSAIGAANDVFDRELDARTKPHKPLVSGAVTVRAAVGVALVSGALALAVGATLGPASFGLAALGLACGLAYDAWLKRTPASALPFMVAVPTLPAWVYVTLDAWEPVLWWLWPLGALLGLAIHLANTAPDVEADAEEGVRGVAHRLGARGAALGGWVVMGAALGLAAAVGWAAEGERLPLLLSVVGGGAALTLGVVMVMVRGERGLAGNFGATAVGAAVAAVGWLAGVT